MPLQCRKLCAAFLGTVRHAQVSLFAESRLEGGGSPPPSLAFREATEIIVDLDLTAENWSHIFFPAEPVDSRAIWKLAGKFIFVSGIFFPGPVPYAFRRRMNVLSCCVFATVLWLHRFLFALQSWSRLNCAEENFKTRYTPKDFFPVKTFIQMSSNVGLDCCSLLIVDLFTALGV